HLPARRHLRSDICGAMARKSLGKAFPSRHPATSGKAVQVVRMGLVRFPSESGCSEHAPAISSGPDRCPVSDHRGQAVPNGQLTAPIFPKDLTTSLPKYQLSLLYRLSDDTRNGTTQTWPDHLSHRGGGRSRRGFDPPAGHHRRYLPCRDRKSTRLNSSHVKISYAVF